MSGRLIDPRQQAERIALQAEGWRSQRDMDDRDEASLRFSDDGNKRLVIVQETIFFTRDDIGSVGAVAYSMRITLPTAAATFNSNQLELYVPGQARVLLVRGQTNAAVTAGTAQFGINVTEDGVTTPYTFEECELSTTHPRTMAAKFDWVNALQIAAGATAQLIVTPDASFAPTTVDVSGHLVIGYEEWISS